MSALRFSVSWLRLLVAAVLIAILLPAGLANADPPGPRPQPVPTIPPFITPPVYCFRITDIRDVLGDPEGNAFDFEFEILNWTNQDLFGIEVLKALDVRGPTFGANPVIAGASVDTDGRPLPGGGASDDLNFSPADGTGMPAKVGAANGFTAGATTPTRLTYGTAGAGVAFRDLLGQPGSSVAQTTAALGLVPGPANFVDPFGRPVIPDFETIDNGGFAGDPLPDNVLDGFVMRLDDFDPGEVISLNWFLEDNVGNKIGTAAGGNAMAFGNFNISRAVELDALWRRAIGDPIGEGQNRGAPIPIGPTRDQFVSVSNGGAVFVPEMGAALTAPFENPADQCATCDVNGEEIPQPQFINVGFDVFETNIGQTFLEFPGQQPIRMQGVPIPDPQFQGITGQPTCNGCDIVVERLGQLDPLGPPQQQVQIEIRELNLQSIDPVDLGLGNGSEFFLVELQPGPQNPGNLVVNFETMTFDYDLPLAIHIEGSNGTVLNDFVSLFVEGAQFSSDDLSKFMAPGINESFLPLQFGMEGGSIVNNVLLLSTVDVPPPPPPPGDYDGDGFITASDYVVWQDHFGLTGTPGSGLPGDGNNDGIVDLTDYGIWKMNFQPGVPGAAQSGGSVPEPASLVLLATLMSLAVVSRRLRIG